MLSLLLIAPVLAMPAGESFETDVQWIDIPEHSLSRRHRRRQPVAGHSLDAPDSDRVLISWNYIDQRMKEFYAFLLLLEFGLIGVFAALDLFLFYVFWEVSLVPMYFLIGIWGHERRIYAAVKFFLYTMAGSVLMLAAIIYLYNTAGTFDYPVLLEHARQRASLGLSRTEQIAAVPGVLRRVRDQGSAVPAAYLAAGRARRSAHAGSVMLASVMLKMGTYGMLRFCLPMFPNAARECAPWIVALAIIGIIYGALVALVQPNMKKLVAYSSVSHLGFVVLGHFFLQRRWARRRGVPDAGSRHLDRRALHAGRLCSTSAGIRSKSRTTAAWRRRAVARDGLPDHDAREHRAAAAEQFRGRVPGAAGRGDGEFPVGGVRGDRRDSLGLLHAVDVPARVLRRDARRCPASHARSEYPRVVAVLPLIVLMVWMGM